MGACDKRADGRRVSVRTPRECRRWLELQRISATSLIQVQLFKRIWRYSMTTARFLAASCRTAFAGILLGTLVTALPRPAHSQNVANARPTGPPQAADI